MIMLSNLNVHNHLGKVSIPEELCSYVIKQTKECGKYPQKQTKGNNTHQFVRDLGFYLLLKTEAPGSGCIKNYTKQIFTLSKNFNISPRSFYTHLKAFESMKLAVIDVNLHLAGWNKLGRLFKINAQKRMRIDFEDDYEPEEPQYRLSASTVNMIKIHQENDK